MRQRHIILKAFIIKEMQFIHSILEHLLRNRREALSCSHSLKPYTELVGKTTALAQEFETYIDNPSSVQFAIY